MTDWKPDPNVPGWEVRDNAGKTEQRRSTDCTQRGHCWHEADGSLYQRHSGRSEGDAAVHCCFCGATNALPMQSRFTSPGLIVGELPHGSRSGLPIDAKHPIAIADAVTVDITPAVK